MVNFCMHDVEWEAFHRIRKEVLFDPAGIVYDINPSNMKDPNWYHMVLYKGVDIIGVASVQFLKNAHEAALRPFAILPEHQGKGLGQWFLTFIEKWVKLKGKSTLKMHASLKAERFYRRLGYSDMSFHEPTPFKDIVDLGKIL